MCISAAVNRSVVADFWVPIAVFQPFPKGTLKCQIYELPRTQDANRENHDEYVFCCLAVTAGEHDRQDSGGN